MEPHQTTARARKGASVVPATNGASADDAAHQQQQQQTFVEEKSRHTQAAAPLPSSVHGMSWSVDGPILAVLTGLSILLRFYKIWHPAEVVFDEVHFGKFASYYLRREYFFDVHPPLAKLLNALSGWLVGFDGSFEFENISDSYTEHGVPYIGMRAMPAFMGALKIPIVYSIMRETGHATLASALSAVLLLLDNAHIAQDRLILLDAALILFMSLSIFCYVKFYKQRYNEFSFWWWTWMLGTGINLALTMSCKMVGLFTFMTIGSAVVVDLWNLLDIKRGLPIQHVAKHFWARTVGLIIVPAFVYLFWFWVHFAILTRSGPGDAFMSAEFQETLDGNPMLEAAKNLHYGDKITIRHKGTNAFLHSHVERYPLKYDDGRISSQGQQVTGYPYNDTNNVWQIVAPGALHRTVSENGDEAWNAVRHMDHVRLLHVNTQSYLLAHDVASPLMATNEEFTTWPANDTSRFNDTLFELNVDGLSSTSKRAVKSKSAWFRLIHVPTRVSMWTHTETPLPEWAFNQQEVNGNKNANEKTALWFIEDLYPDEAADDFEERNAPPKPRQKRKMSFLRKFLELQMTMLHQNNVLTQSHPYATGPMNWPFLLQGISFWTNDKDRQQIYLIGNIISWWFPILSVSVLVGIIGANTLARRRGFFPIPGAVEERLYRTTGFFAVAWACHYLPFYLMQRQLFIHHYLPAHLASCLVAGSVFNFIATESVNYPVSSPGKLLTPAKYRARQDNANPLHVKMVAGVIVAAAVVVFWHISPLSYGTPGLTPAQVASRKWLQWSLHFLK